MPRWAQYNMTGLAAVPWLARFIIREDGVGVGDELDVFLLVWLLVSFTRMPIGVRSQQEEADIVEVTEPGAPVAPMLLKKAWWTTVITSGIWIVYYVITESGVVERFLPTDGYWG